ncbi:MAG TPA: protein phosphatase 2C domain-containing protein [Xanthobacteraceae bacterium]|nr:protein phosphatase 2C domain-containing protein [Xanthobacteraceae bacterium]
MQIQAASFCRRGQKQTNDDSVLPLLQANGAWWAAVADGMGGHPGGALASSHVIDVIRAEIESSRQADIANLFARAQQSLSALARERPEFATMGTTLSLLRLTPRGGEIGHVGDSRIYQLRSENWVARTVDQTEVEQLVQRGVLTRAEARYYPRRNILLSVLSASTDYRLQRETFDIRARDRFVLLTDGVTENLLPEEIRDLSLGAKDVQALCDAIQAEVENRSPHDDYTALCLEILEL